jgi:hypothetical protein
MQLELHELRGCGFKPRRPHREMRPALNLDRALSSDFDKKLSCRSQIERERKRSKLTVVVANAIETDLLRIPAVMQMTANGWQSENVPNRIVAHVAGSESRVLTT